MRPNWKTERDPLDVAKLPIGAPTNLEYRTSLSTPRTDAMITVWELLTIAAVSGAVLILLRVSSGLAIQGESWLPSIWPILWMMALPVCLLVALLRYLFRAPMESVLAWVLLPTGTLIALLLVETGVPPLRLLLPVSLLVLWLIDRIATHAVAHFSVHPLVPFETGRKWRATWQERFAFPWRELPDRLWQILTRRAPALAPPAAEVAFYPAAAGVVVLTTWVIGIAAVGVTNPDANVSFAGMVALLVGAASLMAFWTAWNRSNPSYRIPLRTALWVTGWGIVHWCRYNAHGTPAPGVFQSPCGTTKRRLWLLGLTLALITLILLPFASYFPLVPGVVPEESGSFTARPNVRPLTSQEARESLSASERLYFDDLSPVEQQAYVQRIIDTGGVPAETQSPFVPPGGTPERWIIAALVNLFHLDPVSSLGLFISILLSLLAPPLVLFGLTFLIAGRVLTVYYVAIEAPGPPKQADDARTWDERVRRLQYSPYRYQFGKKVIDEAQHLLLGQSVENDYPVLLHRDILKEHAHFMGRTGAGKTSMGITPLVAQLIRRRDASVIILDLKGERALFETIRQEAQNASLSFKWFTTQGGVPTYVFNPFLQLHRGQLNIHQMTAMLLEGLGIVYGERYGEGYYSAVQRTFVFRALRYNRNCCSFRDLYETLHNESVYHDIPPSTKKDSMHAKMVLEILSIYEALNAAPPAYSSSVLDQGIQLSELAQTPCVQYFHLAASQDREVAAQIGRVILYLLTAAARLSEGPRIPIYVVIDEFQQIATSHLEVLLQQSRDWDMRFILANQTMQDLLKDRNNLFSIVYENTRLKQLFAVVDVEHQDQVMKASGEALYHLYTRGFNSRGYETEQEREEVGPRFGRNDLIEMSNAERRCVLQVTQGKGLTQFGGYNLMMDAFFHISEAEYRRRQNGPWPLASTHTITPDPANVWMPRERDPVMHGERDAASRGGGGPHVDPEELDELMKNAAEEITGEGDLEGEASEDETRKKRGGKRKSSRKKKKDDSQEQET